MRRSTLTALIATAALLLASVPASAATTVALGDNFFSPASKTVRSGALVRFDWRGSNRHNVTKRSGPGAGFGSVTTARPGVHFARTFRRAGTYRLYCTIHPVAMRMTLTVR